MFLGELQRIVMLEPGFDLENVRLRNNDVRRDQINPLPYLVVELSLSGFIVSPFGRAGPAYSR